MSDSLTCKDVNCKMTFQTKEECIYHFLMKHDEGDRCPLCIKMFKSIANHLKGHKEHEGDFDSKERFCEICEMKISSLQSHRTHMKKHISDPPVQCDICDKTLKRSTLYSHKNDVHTEEFGASCLLCKSSFKTSRIYKKHLDSDSHKTNEWKKEQMSTNERIDELTNQIAKVKIAVENLVDCSLCDKTFTTKQILTRHLMNIHFWCKHCKTTSESKEEYHSHMNDIHSTISSFVCHCGVSFARKDGLIRHDKEVHNSVDQQMICPHCNKQMTKRKYKETHSKKCPILLGQQQYPGESIGERLISKIFIENDIDFIREWPVVIDKKYHKYDFYLPYFDCLLEYNGIQHYESYTWDKDQKKLESVQKSDYTKLEYARRINKNLIVIDSRMNATEEQLKTVLRENNILI